MVQLIHYPLCPLSRTARLLLKEFCIEAALPEEKPWEWRQPFLAVNPGGNLPVLLLDNAAVSGIYPVTEYLMETNVYTPEAKIPELLPEEPVHRAEVRRMVDWFHNKFYQEVWSYIFYEKVENPFVHRKSPNPEAIRAAMANMHNHMAYLSRLLEERYWIGGDYISIADLAAAAHLSCLDFLGDVTWERTPIVKNWYARVKSRPSFRPLLQDTVPGIVPPAYYTNLDF